jgi:hypothetical protein
MRACSTNAMRRCVGHSLSLCVLMCACVQVRKMQRVQAQHAASLEQASETIIASIKGALPPPTHALPAHALPVAGEISKLSGSFRSSA